MVESLFKLRAAGVSARGEVLAGLTTFLTMASILFVNPDILAQAGMDHGAVFVATCLAAAIGSAVMGLLANYPIAQAPGMGINAFFTLARFFAASCVDVAALLPFPDTVKLNIN